MNVDPNVYALQISMDMDTVQAEQTLDQFGDSLTAIEDNISASASKAFGKIETLISGINDGLADISKYATMTLGDMEDEVRKLKERDKLQDVFEDFMEKENDFFKGLIKDLDTIIKSLKLKNIEHKNELGYVEEENEALADVAEGVNKVRANAELTSRAFQKVLRTIKLIGKAVIASDEAAESFVTSNWRAYGSQQMLAQEVRSTAIEYGILSDKAEEAMVVMGTMKVPRDELRAYTKTVAEAHRYTGMSIQSIGQYGHKLRQTSLDAAGFEKHLQTLSATMRATKLSTEDLQNVIGGIELSPAAFEFIYGEGQFAKFTEMNAMLAGIAGQAGVTSDRFAQFSGILSDFHRKALFEGAAGINIKSADDWAMAVDNVGKKFYELNEENERYRELNNGMDSTSLINQMDVLEKTAGLTRGQGAEMARLHEFMVQHGIDMQTEEGRLKYAAELTDSYSDATNTLTMQMKLLKDNTYTLFKYAIEPLRYALLQLLKPINYLLSWISFLVVKFGELWAMVSEWPIIGPFLNFVKFLAGAIGILVIGLVAATTAFAGFAIAAGGVVGVFKGALVFIRVFSKAMTQLATAVGKSIVILLTSIGQGLAALGKAVQPVMVPLLAVGAALMMAGIGAYFFAQGVSVLMEMGWQKAVVGIILMVAAIGLLGLVLVGLAYLAAPVAPVLLILGAVFLMIGAAAWLMGAGLLMASKSLEAVAEFGSKISIATWFKLAAGIAMVGAAGYIAGPGLIMAGLGLMMIGAAAMVAAKALAIVMEIMKEFGTELIVDIGKAVFTAMGYFLGAAVALALIGPILMIAAVTLLVGSAALIAAMPLLISASLLLGVAGVAMVLGGALLTIGATAMFIGAGLLALAGTLAFMGAGFLAMAAAVIFPASAAIYVSSFLLLKAAGWLILGSAALIPAAVAIGVAGAALTIGGLWLRAGAWSLSTPAERIYEAGRKIGLGAMSLGKGASELSEGVALVDNAIEAVSDIDVDVLEEFAEDLAGISSDFSKNFEKAFNNLSKLDDVDFSGEGIFKLTDALDRMSSRMQDSVTMFKKPASELTMVLKELGDAVAGFGGVGDTLADDLEGLVSTLDSYAVQLESAAERIETAVETKALPAARAAERAGIQEAIRSEAITSIEVMPAAEGKEDKTESLLQEQNTILLAMAGVLETMGGGTDVSNIKELLESHLTSSKMPPESGLSSSLNRWAT